MANVATTPSQKKAKLFDKRKERIRVFAHHLDKLVSGDEYDFTVPVPFDASELRPYSKTEDKPKVVYKDKIVEKKVFSTATATK